MGSFVLFQGHTSPVWVRMLWTLAETAALHTAARFAAVAAVPEQRPSSFSALEPHQWSLWGNSDADGVGVEFKEIRKEWKQRKKEEENQRKQQEERERSANGPVDGQAPDQAQPGQAAHYPPGVRPSLPPIGYAPADGQVPSQYPSQQAGMVYQQGNGQMGYPPANSYPHSPYSQGNPQYAQQRELSRALP